MKDLYLVQNKKCLLFALLSICLISCKKDFLEVVDKSVLLKEGYVVDIETTEHYLNGVYYNLGLSAFSAYCLPIAELVADNIKPAGQYYTAPYNWSFTPIYGGSGSLGSHLNLWRYYYLSIRDCNFVIEKVNKYSDQNPEKADNLKGQALAIRALLHFYLVNIFAQSYNYSIDGSHMGIPLITTSDTEVPVSRQTVAQVYEGMISDLKAACQILPKSVSKKEFMNYYAAKALLSRVYLFRQDFEMAKNLSIEVLKDKPLMSVGYPEKLYSTDESEALFRLPPGGGAGDYFPYFMGPAARSQLFLAINDIAQLLQENPNDRRRNWVTQVPAGWMITKFPKSATGLSSSADNDHYQVLFRSTEMALNAAEAYANLNIADSARHYLDLIRKRAIPNVPNLTATGTALMDSIYKERRKEMCFDGLRMFDILRWKQDVNRKDALSSSVQKLSYPSDRAIAPIPQQDVELSNLPQNPGY